MIFMYVVISWRVANYPGLAHEAILRFDKLCHGGVSQTWYQSTRLAVDYPSTENPAVLLTDTEPMDLTHLRLTSMASVVK
jgi:hypothetical protein